LIIFLFFVYYFYINFIPFLFLLFLIFIFFILKVEIDQETKNKISKFLENIKIFDDNKGDFMTQIKITIDQTETRLSKQIKTFREISKVVTPQSKVKQNTLALRGFSFHKKQDSDKNLSLIFENKG
jgi:predicted RND superfamily exporter protein